MKHSFWDEEDDEPAVDHSHDVWTCMADGDPVKPTRIPYAEAVKLWRSHTKQGSNCTLRKDS